MVRRALFLAAGFGSRLGGVAKALVRVGERLLGWYPLSVLHAVGVSEACIVTRRDVGVDVGRLAASVYGGGSVNVVFNDEPERENGYSLLVGVEGCGFEGERFLVSMIDHIYSPLIPLRLAGCSFSGRRGYVIAGDSNPSYVDVGEATLIEASGWVGFRVGKGLSFWSYVDVGVHLYDSLTLHELYDAAGGGEVVRLNSITDGLARRGLLRVADVTGLPWTEVDTPEDLEEVTRGVRREVVEHVEAWLRG